MNTLSKQDRTVARTPQDVERRYRLNIIEKTAQDVDELKEDIVVDSALSISSTHPVENRVITEALSKKVSAETGKGLSSNDFTDEHLRRLNQSFGGNHSHDNKYVLDGITQDDINNWNNSGESSIKYFLTSYFASGVSALRYACTKNNDRVCLNFVGTKTMSANATTTLMTLPSELRPSETRDFVVFGQSSNTNGYVGYGYITPDGLLQVRFNDAISSYIRFSVTYDLY
jgi:hypothetical protein